MRHLDRAEVFGFNPYEEVDFRGSREIEVVSLIYGKNEGEPDTKHVIRTKMEFVVSLRGGFPKR